MFLTDSLFWSYITKLAVTSVGSNFVDEVAQYPDCFSVIQ